MLSRQMQIVVAILGTALMATFVIGLAHSISTGFAGFWGGIPVTIIVAIVLVMALYDLWEETIHKD
ncbi:hypothetical protein HJ526_13730 [Donghicola sp. C2-DW-16]|uniref:Uncharacterized protein n=1 Tax=Donghicola mangrovi TaxID=2729614 RepID=A0ABX2PH99_9RHOB|nr:hypothetical protein [Donghicola mangrovi]NVO28486.1 hypothetical protein [Donghicola mangrovi]